MVGGDRLWLVLPQQVRDLPGDLAAVLCYLLVANLVVFVPVVNETVLRPLVGLLFVLFVPGYAFLAAVFPEAHTEARSTPREDIVLSETDDESPDVRGITVTERLILSVALSIGLVPFLGLVLELTPWRLDVGTVVLCLTLFVVGCTVIGAYRRQSLPETAQFTMPVERWVTASNRRLFDTESQADLVVSVLVVVSVLLAAASVGYIVANPKQGEAFTELYLLTEDENGTLTAGEYPTDWPVATERTVVVGIGNHEHRPYNYTVVVEHQRVAVDNESIRVRQTVELRRITSPRLADNETWHHRHQVAPPLTGNRTRLVYMLYRGSAPENPAIESAYRETHLWLNVSARPS